MKRRFNLKRLEIILGSIFSFIFLPYWIGIIILKTAEVHPIFEHWGIGFLAIGAGVFIISVVGALLYGLFQYIFPKE